MKLHVLLVLAFGLTTANGARIEIVKLVNESTEDEVDFSFMTKDLRYPSHDAGFFGTIKEWFGGRATDDTLKEEIVVGHTCAKRGKFDETYYASSFCYWLPEFNTGPSSSGGIFWKGGAYPGGKRLSGRVQASGQCVKTSVCHNNARSEDGDVDKNQFMEVVPLPSGCLKERFIEDQCVSRYDVDNMALKEEDARCHEVEGRYDRAVKALRQCESNLQRLPNEINLVLPRRIRKAENDVIRNEERLRSDQRREQEERHQMHRRCQRYQNKKGNLQFMNMLMGATSTETLLSHMHFHCSYPQRPIDNHDGHHFDEMIRYRNNMEVYHACQECERAQGDLRRANRAVDSSMSRLRSSRAVRPRLEQEMRQKQQELSNWQTREPSLRSTKAQMDGEWLPQSSECRETYSNYKNGKARAISKCAPTFYEDSCEKACVDAQHGCGVVEGLRPGSSTGAGGVEVKCEPLQPSWVLGPFTYGAHEAPGEQCKRIETHQKVQYATKILKSGWLWKKGRVGGWDKRYFQLESGDDVRSAVMRYWTEDPTKAANAEERASKGIILRDATGVKAKDGDHYGFKDGEECFKLYHFYRDYRLCVTSDAGDGAEDERDEWMKFVEESITG